jgi:hypothetical protein
MTDGSDFGFPPFQEAHKDEVSFYAALGRMTVEWNLMESNVRGLLGELCGNEGIERLVPMYILTVELGSLGLINALDAVANELLPADQAVAVKHATKYFDTLRVYRNYYTHDLNLVQAFADGTIGMIGSIDAKAKLVFRQEKITEDRLVFVAKHAHILCYYIRGIISYRLWMRHPEREQLLRPPELPRMPPVPAPLQKPGIRLGLRPQSGGSDLH